MFDDTEGIGRNDSYCLRLQAQASPAGLKALRLDPTHYTASEMTDLLSPTMPEPLDVLRRRVVGRSGIKIVGQSVKLSVSMPASIHRKLTKNGQSYSERLQALVQADIAQAEKAKEAQS